MSKIIMLRGLPASGKSTWAKQYIIDNPDFIIVNRDSIRDLLGNPNWNSKFEKDVVEIERLMANAALRAGKSVIIDATNFKSDVEAYWEELAKCYESEFEIKFFDTPVEVCIERDSKRDKSVGRIVIYTFNKRYINKEQ